MNTQTVEIKEINDEKGFVLLEDGEKLTIQTSSEGHKYVSLRNKRNPEKFGLYMDCVKDAVEDIINGYGHALFKSNSLFGGGEAVAFFLDQKIGENFRNITIENFKDVQFAFSIKIGGKNSFTSTLISKSENFFSPLFEEDKLKFFDTLDEAESFVIELKKKASALASDYKKIKSTGDENAIKDFISKDESSPIVRFLWHSYAEDNGDFYIYPIQTIKH